MTQERNRLFALYPDGHNNKNKVPEWKGAIVGSEKGKSSAQDKTEGAADKAKGRLKEAAGALSGDKEKKSEGKASQRSGTMKEKKGHLKDLLK